LRKEKAVSQKESEVVQVGRIEELVKKLFGKES